MRSGSIGPVSQADLDNVAIFSRPAFADDVLANILGLGRFLHKVVVQRTDAALRS